jgi:hypothetical protein
MKNLEAGQTWSNGKTTRRIDYVTNFVHFHWNYPTVSGRNFNKREDRIHGKEDAQLVASFIRWITRTGAKLQETKP